jgi:hypothetical protein
MNSNKMSNPRDLTIKFNDFNASNLSFTKLEENDRSKGQKIAYVRYKNPKTNTDVSPYIQLPFIKLSTYGIPRIDEYHPDDSKRGYIKLPLDQSEDEVKQFSQTLKMLDDYLSSDEMREQLFGSMSSKYRYVGLFRVPDDEERTDKNKKPVSRPPYIKVKLNTTYPDNQVLTQVYKSVMEEDKRVRTLITDITSIDDLTKHVSYLSKVRLIIRPVKLWSATKPDKTYGLTFKVMKIEYEPSERSSNNFSKEYLNADVFVDGSDEETPVKPLMKMDLSDDEKPVSSKPPLKKPVEVADNDSSDDEPVVKAPPKKQTAKVVEVESDDSSDDEPVVKKQPARQVNIASDDDSSDDEPVVKAPPKKQPAKVVEVESDDSDDSDEPRTKAPAKKVVASKTKSKK